MTVELTEARQKIIEELITKYQAKALLDREDGQFGGVDCIPDQEWDEISALKNDADFSAALAAEFEAANFAADFDANQRAWSFSNFLDHLDERDHEREEEEDGDGDEDE
jgi:hypothetical protein